MTAHTQTNKPLNILASIFILFTSLGLFTPPTLTTHAQTSIPNIPENPYGVNTFLHKEVEFWKIEKTLGMIAAANIQWIKQEFPWQEIEFKKNYFQDDKWNKSSWEKFDTIVDYADKYHINIIARIDHPPDWAKAAPGGDSPLRSYNDLAEFTNTLLDRYKGRINHVQIWNEPNLAAEWVPGKPVDPDNYATMMKRVYPKVKEAHPNAVIISAPMAMTLEGPALRGNMNELDYWAGLYAAGIKGNFDVASANGYGLDLPPQDPPSKDKINFRRVELIRDVMVKNGDENRPIWFNEYGWNASPETLSDEQKNYWRHVTPQQQASWTIEGIDYARTNWPWAGVVAIWYFRQVGDIPPDKAEYYFQMVDPEFVPQPVHDAVKVNASNYPGPAVKELPTPINQQPTPTPETNATPGETPQASPTSTTQPTTTVTATPPGSAPTATATVVVGVTVVGSDTGTASLILYVVGGLLVVAGLGGLGYYFMKGKTEKL